MMGFAALNPSYVIVAILAEAAAKSSRAARILAQPAALHQHRAFELDALDRAVAHVALADRNGGGFAVLRRPSAPAAAFEALHHETPPGLRMHPEKDHGAAEQAVMAGRYAVGHRLGERRHDGVHHGRH